MASKLVQMSKGQTYSRNAVCPFFIAAWERGVRCEGVAEGSQTKTVFKSEEKCRRFITRNCMCWNYINCPLYKAIENKGNKSQG